MGFSERYPNEGNEETPKVDNGYGHDNGTASGGTCLPTEYRPSCAL